MGEWQGVDDEEMDFFYGQDQPSYVREDMRKLLRRAVAEGVRLAARSSSDYADAMDGTGPGGDGAASEVDQVTIRLESLADAIEAGEVEV